MGGNKIEGMGWGRYNKIQGHVSFICKNTRLAGG